MSKNTDLFSESMLSSKEIIYYINEGDKKIDKNFYYNPETALERAAEIANYLNRYTIVHYYRQDLGRNLYARVYPGNRIEFNPARLYDELKNKEKELEYLFKSKVKNKIQKVKKVLEDIKII